MEFGINCYAERKNQDPYMTEFNPNFASSNSFAADPISHLAKSAGRDIPPENSARC